MGDSAFFRIIQFLMALFTLIVAVLTTFTYIGSNYGGMFQIFAIYGLIQPILILLNIAFLVYWVIRVKYWVIIPIFALVTNFESISSVFQIPFKNNSILDNGEENFRIGTYNVKGFYHGQRNLTVSMTSDFMKEKQVDILCLQEVDFDTIFSIDSIYMAFNNLPYRSVVISERPGFSLMILSKFPILQSGRIRFVHEGNQAMYSDLLVNGDTLRIFNFHLQTTNFNQARFPLVPEHWLWDWTGEAKKSMRVYDVLRSNFSKRTQQAAYLQSKIIETKYPTLVCGDMNANPSSYTYHQIKGTLKDGFKTCGSGYEYTLNGLHKLFRIDYIFHSKTLRGLNYNSYVLDFSDHKPVIMETSLKKPAPNF